MIANDSLSFSGYAARFVVSKDDPNYYFSDTAVSATAGTFMPDVVNGVLETSVFLHENKDDIPWHEGARAFKALKPDGSLGKRPALAADIPCEEIVKAGLTIVPDVDNDVLPHHANIRSWDVNDASLQSAQLAAFAQMHVNPARNDKFAQDVRLAISKDSLTR